MYEAIILRRGHPETRGPLNRPGSMYANIVIAAIVLGCWSFAVQAGTNTWTSNGPYGGTVSVLAIDPHTPANLYAAGFSGVFKSSNAGASWTRASNGIIDASVDALAIDPVTSTTLYAGSVQGGAVVKSVDSAATWVPLSGTGTPTLVVALAIDPSTPATVYASRQQGGISKSINGGATWAPIGVATLPSFPTFKTLVIDPTTPSTLYAGDVSNGVYKSVDSGVTWSPANTGFTGAGIQILRLAIDPQTTSTLYATGSTSGSQSGLFKSIDGGAHWTLIVNGNVAAYNFSIQTVSVDPQTSTTLYLGTENGVFKSVNGGTSFAPIHTGMPPRFVNVLAINPASPATLYAGTEDGIFATTNGGAMWAGANSGLSLTTVSAVAVDPTTPTTIYAGTASSGIFKSLDSGGSWVAIDNGIGATDNLACNTATITSVAIDPATPTTLYAGTRCTEQSGVLKSTNGGDSWSVAATGLPLFMGISAVAVDPLTTSTVYAGTDSSGLFRSIDGGSHWAPASGFPVNARVTGLSVPVLQGTPSASSKALRSLVRDFGPVRQGAPPTTNGGGATPAPMASTSGNSAQYSVDGGANWQPLPVDSGTAMYCEDLLTSVKSPDVPLGGANRFRAFVACLSLDTEGPNSVMGYQVSLKYQPAAGLDLAKEPASASDVVRTSGAAISVTAVTPWAPPNGSNALASACSPVTSIIGNPFDVDSFYGGAACGVLSGTQGGQLLVTMNAGLPTNLQINALATSPTRLALYAGATSGGVYQFTFGAQAPTKLGITDVNGGADAVAGAPFNVVVTAQAADFSPQNVAAATTAQLSVSTGAGTLGGATTCQIPAGSSKCTVTGATYSQVDTGVVLAATRISGDALASGNSAPFDVAAVGAPPNLVSAVSRKVHGSAGTFDLPLSAVATNPTTEPRLGPTQSIVFTFDKPISAATITITEGTATAAAPTFSGDDVIVSLTGVSNQQYVTIGLTNVASSDGGSGGAGGVRIGFLAGDVNQNRVVTVADLGLVNAQLAQVVTAANYLKDVNASGTLSVADKAITNANLTKALPAP